MKPAPNETLAAYAARVAARAAALREEARMLASTGDTYHQRAEARRELADTLDATAADAARAASSAPDHVPVVVRVDPRPVDLDGLSPTEARILDVIGTDRVQVAEVMRRVRDEYGATITVRVCEDGLRGLGRRGLVELREDGWVATGGEGV